MTLHDHLFYLTMATSSLAGLAIIAGATLRGWRGWLDFKRAELEHVGGARPEEASIRLPSAERIEMANLKERIRKLEAIAAGVDI